MSRMLRRSRVETPGPQSGYNSDVAKTKMGRPRRATRVADELVAVRLTKAERRAWEKAAGELSLSEWIRETCNAKAGL